MSVRTKLIFLFVLLALIASTVTYGILTWDVKEPLRFQAVSYERDGEPPPGREEVGTLWVQIENTSDTPLVIYSGMLVRAPMGYVSHLQFLDAPPNQEQSVDLRGKQTVRAKVINWNPRGAPLSGFEDVTASYLHVSKTQSYWVRFREWLNESVLARWDISRFEILIPGTETVLLPASHNGTAK